MSDIADVAEQQEEMARQSALCQARKGKSGPHATGECLFCGEPVARDVRWCNTECRNDWDRRDKLRGGR